MKDEKRATTGQAGGSLPNRILGSLRDALNAASRDDRSGEITLGDKAIWWLPVLRPNPASRPWVVRVQPRRRPLPPSRR